MTSKNFKNRLESDSFFMNEALLERIKTDDPKGQIVHQSAVGAVIEKDGNILARSANVLPPTLKNKMEDSSNRISDNDRYFIIEHAERAAIYNGLIKGKALAGATIYCTRFPCSDCARAIVWAGIKRAVFAGGFAGEQRWLESQRAALRILRDSGVTVKYLSPPKISEDAGIK